MTRAQIRTLLRKQINDVSAVQWPTNGELDEIINMAYALVQKEIRKVDAEAHIFWDHLNLDANVSWYPLPPTFSVLQINLKDPSSGLYYPISPKRYRDIGSRKIWSGAVEVAAASISTDVHYTLRGDWIGIFPAPAADLTDGLEVMHCPIMSLGVDSEVPRIKVPLHLAIVYWAKLICLGDTDEGSGETRTRLQEMLGDIGMWYNQNGDEAEKLIVEI